MNAFDVVVEGQCLPGFEREAVRLALAKLTRRSEDTAGRLLAGRRVVVKRGVDLATATRYVEALRAIGVASHSTPDALQLDGALIGRVAAEPAMAVAVPSLAREVAATPDTPEGKQQVPMEAFYKAAIGPTNQPFYLNYFSKSERHDGFLLSWHWPACFVTLGWLLYRKLFVWAILYLAIAIAIGSGGFAAYKIKVHGPGGNPFEIWQWLLIALWILSFVAPAALANGVYYRYVRSKVATAEAAHQELSHQLREVTLAGGTSWLAAVVGLLIYIVVIAVLRLIVDA